MQTVEIRIEITPNPGIPLFQGCPPCALRRLLGREDVESHFDKLAVMLVDPVEGLTFFDQEGHQCPQGHSGQGISGQSASIFHRFQQVLLANRYAVKFIFFHRNRC